MNTTNAKSARDGFKRGSTEMLVLALLNKEEMYGYQLSQMIYEKSNEVLTIQEGSLYPVLYRLEEQGYVNEEKRLVGKRRQRSYYIIQPDGKRRLQELKQEYRMVQDGIEAILNYLDTQEEDNAKGIE